MVAYLTVPSINPIKFQGYCQHLKADKSTFPKIKSSFITSLISVNTDILTIWTGGTTTTFQLAKILT